ncbi:MAG: hypothetical protein LBB86_04515 [Oscillospiraceae bacterium]|nr:hypothetical protein [Oscillospiraceae bacterium]
MYDHHPPRKRTYTTATRSAKRPAKNARFVVRRPSRRRAQLLIRRLIIAAIIITASLLAVYGIMQRPRGDSKPKALAFSPDDTYAPFNGGLLYLSGGQLNFIGAKGAARALLPLGEDGMFYASGQFIVAWRGVQIYILNANGDVLYNDRAAAPIQFARVGASYAAALSPGVDGGQNIDVITHNGTPVWSIDVGTTDILDMQFFGTQDLRLLTVGLDATGATPSSVVATYEPKRYEVTGNVTLYDQIVYKVFQRGSNLMMVNSVTMTAYDYRCVTSASIPPVTVYGWQQRDIRAMTGDSIALFTPISSDDSAVRQARLITSGGETALRLPAPCIDVRLGSRSVYAFASNAVYAARYGADVFTAYTLPAAIDRVLCVLDGDRAVVASGNDVFWVDLPAQ